MADRVKRGEDEIQKFTYLKNKKSFLDGQVDSLESPETPEITEI